MENPGQDVNERNRASMDRLRYVAARLSEDELLLPIDPPWTTSALYAHIAFWDRFAHARWMHTVTTGSRTPLQIEDDPLELVNEAGLPGWTATPPRVAIEQCLDAAETVNRFLASLDEDTVSEVVRSGRERLANRSLHRGEHLRTIEQAFAKL